MSEQVNHPSHYQKEGRKECIEEMTDTFGRFPVLVWCLLNTYKYNYRAGQKEGNSEQQDRDKAKWYADYAKSIYSRIPEACIPTSIEKYYKSLLE